MMWVESDKVPAHESLAEAQWRWNYLLIDGVAMPAAEKQLYQECENPEHLNLYAGTEYSEISDVGPVLVRITSEHPLARRLVEEFSTEWGYLLASSQDLLTLAAWFRQFITVAHPTGVELFLRFALPAVAAELFGDAGLFRRAAVPVDEVLMPDSLEWRWRHVQLPSVTQAVCEKPLILTEPEIEALTRVDWRNLLRTMVAHLDEFFPGWARGPGRNERIANLNQLLNLALQANYVSERALTQWTDVFGFLAPVRVPEDLPENIQALLRMAPADADVELAARNAAVLARQALQPSTQEHSRTESIQ